MRNRFDSNKGKASREGAGRGFNKIGPIGHYFLLVLLVLLVLSVAGLHSGSALQKQPPQFQPRLMKL